VGDSIPISIGMPLARQNCLHSSGLWTSCFREMCVPWGTKRRDGTFSSLPCIRSTRAIGAPFSRSSRGSYINSRRVCTNELLRVLEAGDYHSRSLSPTCSKKRASRALQEMGPSLSIHSLVGSNGIKAIPTCHEGIRPKPQMSQS
jgi:hypothetical protein